MNSVLSRENIIFIYVCTVLFCFLPYGFCNFYLSFLPEKEHYTQAFFLILSFAIMHKKIHVDVTIKNIFFMQLFGFLLVGIFHSFILPVFANFVRMSLSLSLIVLIESTIGLREFFRRYNIWILIMMILGSITFLFILSGFSPISVVEDRGDGRLFFNYILSFSKYDLSQGFDFRPSGFFDEPGTMGNWGLYALVFNKLFIDNKKIERLLSLFIVTTLSLGAIFQLLLYFVVTINFKRKVNSILLLIIPIVAYFALLSTKDTELDFIYKNSIVRVEKTFEQGKSEGNVSVGNREVLADKAYKAFQESPLFGSPKVYDEYMADNIYEPLANYGIIGSLLILSPFIWIFFRSIRMRDYLLLKMWFVLIVGFAHRPFHSQLLNFFIVYSMIILIKQIRCKKNIK